MMKILEFIVENDIAWVIFVWTVLSLPIIIRHLIGLVKGYLNDEDKQKIRTVLNETLPNGEKVIPLYAFHQWGRHGRRYDYYAVGMQKEQMYLVPLQFHKKKITAGEYSVIRKEELSVIILTHWTPSKYYITICYKDGGRLEFEVKNVNTRYNGRNPFNIWQKEETAVFITWIREWCKDVRSNIS